LARHRFWLDPSVIRGRGNQHRRRHRDKHRGAKVKVLRRGHGTDHLAQIAQIACDKRGYLLTGPAALKDQDRGDRWPRRDPYLLETSVPGIFAVGDGRSESIKRVASAVGEGSMAIAFVHHVLAEQSGR